MSKGLKAFETTVEMFNQYANKPDDIGEFFKYTLACAMVEKELKALEVIKNNFRLVGNCLHAKNPYAEDGWVFVKEIEDEEELDAWKEAME